MLPGIMIAFMCQVWKFGKVETLIGNLLEGTERLTAHKPGFTPDICCGKYLKGIGVPNPPGLNVGEKPDESVSGVPSG